MKIIRCGYRDPRYWHVIQCNCRNLKLFNQRYFWWVSWPATILWVVAWKIRNDIKALLWQYSKLIARICSVSSLILFNIYIYIFTRIYLITHALIDVFFAFVGTLDSNYTATIFHSKHAYSHLLQRCTGYIYMKHLRWCGNQIVYKYFYSQPTHL